MLKTPVLKDPEKVLCISGLRPLSNLLTFSAKNGLTLTYHNSTANLITLTGFFKSLKTGHNTTNNNNNNDDNTNNDNYRSNNILNNKKLNLGLAKKTGSKPKKFFLFQSLIIEIGAFENFSDEIQRKDHLKWLVFSGAVLS